MKILFTGGGSGGHVFPIVAIVREIRRRVPKNAEFFYIGPKDNFSSILLSQEGIKIKEISAGKVRRYFGLRSIILTFFDILFRIPIGIAQSFSYIFLLAPDIIFSKGGYGSIPGVIASWILGVPIFLHESDVAPGLANRILSRLSLEVFTSFPKTEYFPLKKMVIVGNPIRKELLEGSEEEAKKLFKITGEKAVVLIMGGSQGATRINDVVLDILPKMLEDLEVIHQTGENNFQQVRAEALAIIPKGLEKYYHPFGFLKESELKNAYKAANFFVGRAGSGTIFEVSALGLPSILVPLPEAAQKHQLKNGYAYSQTKAAIVIEEINLTPYFFLERLKYLISKPEEFDRMSKAAKKFSRPEAAKMIAGYIVDYLVLR